MAPLKVVLCLLFAVQRLTLIEGQSVYLTLYQTDITTNNTEILITDIGYGRDFPSHLFWSLTCNTDLTTCCRSSDSPNGVGQGEWLFPNGSLVPAGSVAYSAPLIRVRNGPQVIRLARRRGLEPTGSYCCVIPTVSDGEVTFCISLVVCRSLPELTNGMISYSDPTLGLNTTATYSCNPGYTLSGGSVRSCGSDGLWSGSASTCQVTNCGHPEFLEHGQVSLPAGTVFSSLAYYNCDSCSSLVGVSVRICGTDGQWIPNPPVCQVIDCGSPPDLVNGRVQAPMTTSCGSVVSYSCDSGYLIEGVGSRICHTNGSWSEDDIVCKPIACESLSNPINGLVWISGTTFMSTVTYHCDTGYELRGAAVRTCGATGSWTPSQPSCDAVNCGSLGPPINGQVDTSQGTTYQKVATYSCNIGYNLIGTNTRICRANGVWSSSQPTCRVVDCGPLGSLTNGHLTLSATTYNSVAVYSCNEGYLLNGAASRTCLASGQWSPSQPTCDPVDCGISMLIAPRNGYVDISRGTHFMDTITYSCDPGYNLTGCSVAECQANGTWSCNPPYCAGNKMIQFKFGPTSYCVEWTEEMVELMYKIMHTSIIKAIGNRVPKENIQQGYFSCYGSTTQVTYRTTITGTESVSVEELTRTLREWVESGVTTRVLWYVIKLDKSCPVAISSMEDGECV